MNFFEMPKIDLHCHLDGSMGIESTQRLLSELGEVYTMEELRKHLCVPMDCQSLAQYLESFDLPIKCIQTKKGLFESAKNLALSAAKENVKYLEVRFAPSFSTGKGLTILEILESVQKGLEEAERETEIKTGIIVCGMRNLDMDTNLSMLKQAREMLGCGVVACDLAGDENAHPTSEFAEFFEKAKRYDMPFTIHSGECGSTENVKAAIELGARRIGHGIAMANDSELMKMCALHKIGVELCPTSNLQTKAVKDFELYPYRLMMRSGIPVSINTDNRTVSDTNSTSEFERLNRQFTLTQDELNTIYINSIDMIFGNDDCKQFLWSCKSF